jgi:hypothetical protein
MGVGAFRSKDDVMNGLLSSLGGGEDEEATVGGTWADTSDQRCGVPSRSRTRHFRPPRTSRPSTPGNTPSGGYGAGALSTAAAWSWVRRTITILVGGAARGTRVVVASNGSPTMTTSPTKLCYYMAGGGRGGPVIIPHAGGSGGGCNGPPVPSPPRCGAVPPAPPPGRADGDNGDHGARAAACGNAGNGDLLRNNDAATAAVAGKADNAGQENDDHGDDDGDNDKNDDKWGRGV